MAVHSPFASAAPVIQLVAAFPAPLENAVAAARTCYSGKGIVSEDDVARNPEQRDRIARSTYAAGHHTTLQHAHFQFALSNVSRQLVWSLLHSHPFYNSEQVSQRYVEVKPGNVVEPRLPEPQGKLYRAAVEETMAAYQRLIQLLTPKVSEEFFRIFPARKKAPEKWALGVKKKSQEIARYVLPVATCAFLSPRRTCSTAPDQEPDAEARVLASP